MTALSGFHFVKPTHTNLGANAVAEAFARRLADEMAYKQRPSWLYGAVISGFGLAIVALRLLAV